MISSKWSENNALHIYEDNILAVEGSLYFKEEKFFADDIKIKPEFCDKGYEDLAVRLIVRRAANMGAEKIYAVIRDNMAEIYENVGFKKERFLEDGAFLMCMEGDVAGHCAGHCACQKIDMDK